MSLKLFLFWLPMIAIAFINATLREMVFRRLMDTLQAQQLSTLTLMIFCSIYVWLIFPKLLINSAKQAVLLGLMWTLLTIGFEFILGGVTGKSWQELLHNYDLFAGQLWPLFLLLLFFLPYCCFLTRR